MDAKEYIDNFTPRSDNPKRDWEEDFERENGNYCCKCKECGNTFIGYKRRWICKLCANDIS